MIREYDYLKDKKVEISPSFEAGEFASIANGKLTTNKILIDVDFIKTKIETLKKRLGADKAIITSGYRDSVCDRLVGGTGKGQHVNGRAIDVIFYKGNNVIDPKIVSCVAQDLGINGIARISNRAIHLDNRTNGKYYGDEMTGHTNTVTKDFYTYYNIKRESIIDSELSDAIDKAAKNFGIDAEWWKKHYNDDYGKNAIKDLFLKITSK